jgi:hypothetical protein
MSKQIRATRYLTKDNEWLCQWLTGDRPYLDFRETVDFFKKFMLDHGVDDEVSDDTALLERNLKAQALLGCNDRYFLLTYLCAREDLLHPWLFARCREVEEEPDGYLDLWARSHGKSSIITFAGTLQDIFCNPELTTAIFSVTKPLAQEFLAQIKNEFETNEHLKQVYSDVLYANPRTKGEDGRPSKWSLQRGITVKRRGKPKEATVEAWGLIDGQPTGRHFHKHTYDDIVTQDHLEDLQLKKTIERFQLADNLGTRHGVRKQIAGTTYHFADCYAHIREKKLAKVRIYPATIDGKLATYRDGNSNLVLLEPENWDRIKRDQGLKVVSAQMLLNPLAGTEATFLPQWFMPYEVVPSVLNVFIMVDPSKGKGTRSDRTAIAVIGIDHGGVKYLLDGYCHRMQLSQRWEAIKNLRRRWMAHPGVQLVRIGYEQYGMLDDISVMQEAMRNERDYFDIEELATPETGGHSKKDRITRLEPDVRNGRFLLPCTVYSFEHSGMCYWKIWSEEQYAKAQEAEASDDEDRLRKAHRIGDVILDKVKGLTRRQIAMDRGGQKFRIVTALRRQDENSDIYDLTRVWMEEARLHPFAPHDDFIDACARIYDMEPYAPTLYERQSTSSVWEAEEDETGLEQ